MTWELHETITHELHVCRPHDPARAPAGRIITYGEGERLRRPPGTPGFDVVAVIMPVYVRRKTGRRVNANEEGECDAIPNRELAVRILALVSEAIP